LARSAMNYLLFYTQYMQICQTTCFCYCSISKTKNKFGTKSGKKTLYWSGPVHIPKYWPVNIQKYWPAALTKTNRENKNVKYNILNYNTLCFLFSVTFHFVTTIKVFSYWIKNLVCLHLQLPLQHPVCLASYLLLLH